MLIKNFLMMICLSLAMVSLSGCSIFSGLKTVELEDVVVKNVSVVDGITVDVKGVECKFSFTTDRQTIFEEIKSCLIDQTLASVATGAVPLVSMTAMRGEAVIDPILISEAEKATLVVISKIPIEK